MKAYVLDKFRNEYDITNDCIKLVYNEVLNGNSQPGTLQMYGITQEIIDQDFQNIEVIEERFIFNPGDDIITLSDDWVDNAAAGCSLTAAHEGDNSYAKWINAGLPYTADYTFPSASPAQPDASHVYHVKFRVRCIGGVIRVSLYSSTANCIYMRFYETTGNIYTSKSGVLTLVVAGIMDDNDWHDIEIITGADNDHHRIIIDDTEYTDGGGEWENEQPFTDTIVKLRLYDTAVGEADIDDIDCEWLPVVDDIPAFDFETLGDVIASIVDIGSGDNRIYIRDLDGANGGTVHYIFEKISPYKPVDESIKITINPKEAPFYVSLFQDDIEIIRLQFDASNNILTWDGSSYIDTTANYIDDTDVDIEIIFDETGKHSFIIDTVTYDNSGALFLNVNFITNKLTSMTFWTDSAGTGKFYIDDIYLSWTNIQSMKDLIDRFIRFSTDGGNYFYGAFVWKVTQVKRNEFILLLKDSALLLEKKYGYSRQNHELFKTDIVDRFDNSPLITVADTPDIKWKKKSISIDFTDDINRYIDDDGAGANEESLEVDSYSSPNWQLKKGVISDVDYKDNDLYMEWGTNHVSAGAYPASIELQLSRTQLTGDIDRIIVATECIYQGTAGSFCPINFKIEIFNYEDDSYVELVSYPGSFWFYSGGLPAGSDYEVSGTLSEFLSRSGGNDYVKIRLTLDLGPGRTSALTGDIFLHYLRVRVHTTESPHDPIRGKITSISGNNIVVDFHPDIGGTAADPYALVGDNVTIGDSVIDALSEITAKFDTFSVETSEQAIFNDMRGYTLLQKLKVLAAPDNAYWYWYMDLLGNRKFFFLPRLTEIIAFENFIHNNAQDISEIGRFTVTKGAGDTAEISITTTDGASLLITGVDALIDCEVDLDIRDQGAQVLKELEFSIEIPATDPGGSAPFNHRLRLEYLGSSATSIEWRFDKSRQLTILDATGNNLYASWVVPTNDYLVFKTIFNEDGTIKVYGIKPGESTYSLIHTGSVQGNIFYNLNMMSRRIITSANTMKIGHLRFEFKRVIGEYDEDYVHLEKGDKLTTWTPWMAPASLQDMYDGTTVYYHIVPDPAGGPRNVLLCRDTNSGGAFFGIHIERMINHQLEIGDFLEFDIYNGGTDLIDLTCPSIFYRFTGDGSIHYGTGATTAIDTGTNLAAGWNTVKAVIASSTQSTLWLNGIEIGTFNHGYVVTNTQFFRLRTLNTDNDVEYYFDRWVFSWSGRTVTKSITAQPFSKIQHEARSLRSVTIRGRHVRRVDDGTGAESEGTSQSITIPALVNADPSEVALVTNPDSPREEFIVDSTTQTAVGLREKAKSFLRENADNGFNIPLLIYEYPEDQILHVGDFVNVFVYGEWYYNQIIRRLKCTYEKNKLRKGQYEIELGKSSTPAMEKLLRKYFDDQDKFTGLDISRSP